MFSLRTQSDKQRRREGMSSFFFDFPIQEFTRMKWGSETGIKAKISKNVHSIIQTRIHYSWFHICEFAYLLKCIYNSKVSTPSAFKVIHRHIQSGKKLESLYTYHPSLGWKRQCSDLCFSLHTLNKGHFFELCKATFFFFNVLLCFLSWFHCLQWHFSIVFKCQLVFLIIRRQWCALQRKHMLR